MCCLHWCLVVDSLTELRFSIPLHSGILEMLFSATFWSVLRKSKLNPGENNHEQYNKPRFVLHCYHCHEDYEVSSVYLYIRLSVSAIIAKNFVEEFLQNLNCLFEWNYLAIADTELCQYSLQFMHSLSCNF